MDHKYSLIDLVVWNGVVCYFGGIKNIIDTEDEVRLADDQEKQDYKQAKHR